MFFLEAEKGGSHERDVLKGMYISAGEVDSRWQAFMKFQISRARMFFLEAEKGVAGLDASARWPVWSALILYRQILDAIEANGFDNFSRRAYVSKAKKLRALPVAFFQALNIDRLSKNVDDLKTPIEE